MCYAGKDGDIQNIQESVVSPSDIWQDMHHIPPVSTWSVLLLCYGRRHLQIRVFDIQIPFFSAYVCFLFKQAPTDRSNLIVGSSSTIYYHGACARYYHSNELEVIYGDGWD